MTRTLAYRIAAHRRGQCIRYLDLIAISSAAAIRTAQELLPGYLITLSTRAPMWEENA
jgi:hypothetical protein